MTVRVGTLVGYRGYSDVGLVVGFWRRYGVDADEQPLVLWLGKTEPECVFRMELRVIS